MTHAADWKDWNSQGPQYQAESEAAWKQVMSYYDMFASRFAPQYSVQQSGQQQAPPAHQGWQDDDLVAAATYWGLPEAGARQLPKEALVQFVNQQRANVGAHSGVSNALAPIAMLGLGVAEMPTHLLEGIPGLGEWMQQNQVVRSVDMGLRQLEEGVRASTSQGGYQHALGLAYDVGNVASMYYPGALAWGIAAKLGKAIPFLSKATPIGRAALQGAKELNLAGQAVAGGATAYALQGGTKSDQPMDQRMEHVALTVGIGAAGAAMAGAIQPALRVVATRVQQAFDQAPSDLMSGMSGFQGQPSGPAVEGNFEQGQSSAVPDVFDLAVQGDPQAQAFVDMMGGGHGGQLTGERAMQFSRREDPVSAGLARAVGDNKAASIIQSPAFMEVGSNTVLDDNTVIHAQTEANPGGVNVLQGIADPQRLLAPNARFALRAGRLDVLHADHPINDAAVAEYEEHGVFHGQRVLTSDGVTGLITKIGPGPQGEILARVAPIFAGWPQVRPVADLHPWLTSPETEEAPEVWDAFQRYSDVKAVETQAAMGGSLTPQNLETLKSQHMATWMQMFFKDSGVAEPGDQARLMQYLNQRYVDGFKELAPAEIAVQQMTAREAAEVIPRPTPVQRLDQHAAVKGMRAEPDGSGAGGWVLKSSDTGDTPTMLQFESKEAATAWVKTVNLDKPDISPPSEVPVELAAKHPIETQQLPNENTNLVENLASQARELQEVEGSAGVVVPPEMHAANGDVTALQNQIQQSIWNWVPMRRMMSVLDQIGHDNGRDYGVAGDYAAVGQKLNLMHSEMEPFGARLANIFKGVREHIKASGEWTQMYEATAAMPEEGVVTKALAAGWRPGEISSLNQFDQLMQDLFPETKLDQIREIPRYISHIAQRQSDPEMISRAFEDFHLGPTTQPYYEMVRLGNLNHRELDPRVLGDTYIRAVFWQKHMAETFNAVESKWTGLNTSDPAVSPMTNFMQSWLDGVRSGYHPDRGDDVVIDTMHDALKRLIDPAITRQQTRDFVLGGLNQSYAGFIGYRPKMIVRHFLQMAYALPRGGTDVLRVLGHAIRSPAGAEAIMNEARADGAIAPRSFTMAAPGALEGELQTTGLGLTGEGGWMMPQSGPLAEHTLRFKAIAAVRNAMMDVVPSALKGQGDSLWKPMGAFSRAVERFQSVVYVAGKQRAAQALAEFRAAGPNGNVDQLLGDSGMRSYDDSWRREFLRMVAAGPSGDADAAKFAGYQLREASFFSYGQAHGPIAARSVTGKIGVQLGNYGLNYYQFLRESLRNGTPGDKAKLLAAFGTTTLALGAASAATGWGLTWLNPWAAGVAPGPWIGFVENAGQAWRDALDGLRDGDLSKFEKSAKVAGQVGREALQFSPVGGLEQAYRGAAEAGDSPSPGLTAADFLLTGHVGSEPEVDRAIGQMMPQAQPGFMQQGQMMPSPVNSGAFGVQGVPPQIVVDPPQIQGPNPTLPGGRVGPGSSTAGVAPGAVAPIVPQAQDTLAALRKKYLQR